VSRSKRDADAAADAVRQADIAALVRVGRYVEGAASAVEREDVRRVVAMLAAAMKVNPRAEDET